jgi:hypothetical protein
MLGDPLSRPLIEIARDLRLCAFGCDSLVDCGASGDLFPSLDDDHA